jgi:hypothetical protein
MKRDRFAIAFGALALLTFVACGGPAFEYDSVVTGTVTVDGDLADSGTVTFHPVKDGRPAIGRINPDGSYSLRTGQGDLREADGGTVMSGEYLVTVNITAPSAEGAVVAEGGPPIPGPSLIHSKYAQKSTTDLRFTVKPGPQVIVLNLEGAEPAPAEDDEAVGSAEGEDAAQSPAEGVDEKAAEPGTAEPATEPPAGKGVDDVTPPATGTSVETPVPENQADKSENQAP